MMSELWASSANDVYAIGHCDDPSGHFYHFDGNNWQPIPLNVTFGGPIHGSYSLNDIYGFDESNVFIQS